LDQEKSGKAVRKVSFEGARIENHLDKMFFSPTSIATDGNQQQQKNLSR
jgi:hypothetical protein